MNSTPLSDPKPIRVMLADDHLMVRDGLKVFLSMYDDLDVVAEAEDGEQAIELCAQVQPDVILMDIVMPNVDGPTATARICKAFPQVQVIALTSFLEEDLVQRALQAGANGYLLKDVHPDKLAKAIRDAHEGRPTIDSAAAQVLAQAARQPPPVGTDLTPREREVLALLTEGMTNKEIAKALTLSDGTVRLHVSNILSKLGVSNRTAAATLALQHDLVPPAGRP
jgi:NarL family two-component system response regulator LiaR